MREQSDEDLFLYMSFYDDPADRVQAEAAFEELHRRYFAELLERCRRYCRRRQQPIEVAEDLASQVMYRALKRAETYKAGPAPGRTMAWLSTIAYNILCDAGRNPYRPSVIGSVLEPDLGAESYSAEDFVQLYHQFESPLQTLAHRQAVAAAFSELDERAQNVLIETLIQRSRSPNQTYMYRGTARQLAERLGLTTDNVRRIRCDSLKAIERRLRDESTRGTARVTTR